MAALKTAPDFDLAKFRADLAGRLPPYARPVLLRLLANFELTETFKQKKAALAEEAFDPARVADALFVSDAALDAYVPVDPEMFQRIAAGRMRL